LRASYTSFNKDDTNRYLPWLIACMVFIITLSIAGISIVNDITQRLGTGFNNIITVQIPVTGSEVKDNHLKSEALRTLRSMNGVEHAVEVKPEGVIELLKPWLGEFANSEQLPIPRVIDVVVDRTTGLSSQNLKAGLEQQIPGVLVDDHLEWLGNLQNTLKFIQVVGFLIVFLIGLATIGTVVFTTQTSMGLQQETISILHFVGAEDRYIAYQFAMRAAWLGVKGGAGGFIVAVPLLLGFQFVLGTEKTGLIPELALHTSGWISVGLVVPCVTAIAVITAYSTVLKSLSNLP